MARANLLNTKTTTFLELIGNGKTFHVPRFQRDYSWEEEAWEDLWRDILVQREDPDSAHYMGALVVESVSDREFQIIDGQQRVATLIVLALAIIARLETLASEGVESDKNRERASKEGLGLQAYGWLSGCVRARPISAIWIAYRKTGNGSQSVAPHFFANDFKA